MRQRAKKNRFYNSSNDHYLMRGLSKWYMGGVPHLEIEKERIHPLNWDVDLVPYTIAEPKLLAPGY